MKKRISIILSIIIFLVVLFCWISRVNADDSIGIMKVYKIKINLFNLDTSDYTIELFDNISNRIYETQDGNKLGEHNFAIATDMDKTHLVNYGIHIKFADGTVKKFDSINVKKLIDIDDDKTDSTYIYEYNLRVKLIPNWLIIVFVVVVVITILVVTIIALKKHKRIIK